MEPVTTLSTASPSAIAARKMPPVLGKLLSGSFWLVLRTPLQVVFPLWTIPLLLQAGVLGPYTFAWGFGFFQFLLEFGMSSSLQRQVSERWAVGDKDGVRRVIACGMNFYAVMALVQIAALLIVAYVALPYSEFSGADADLIVKLLWLQAIVSPCYGISVVLSAVLQAARRYELLPRLELLVLIFRFAILWWGVNHGKDFFAIVIAQTAVQIGLTIVPALWVTIRELGHMPGFRGSMLADYRSLIHISFYMFLIQISVMLSDKMDTTILGFATLDPDKAIEIYTAVSKPFATIRQTGWTLAYLVMPAVTSLLAGRDFRALERVKYDGTRLHIASLTPIALLAWIYAGPFLTLWIGDKFGYDAAREAPLLRLFLIAVIPLILSVPVQIAFGMNKVEVVAIAALVGSLINFPLSLYLTVRLGVSGVIWGTVVTTLFSNLLVPGYYVFKELEIDGKRFFSRTLGPPFFGALALLVAATAAQTLAPLHPSVKGGMSLGRWMPLVWHLSAGCVAFALGYLATPTGRSDAAEVLGKLRRRVAAESS